MFRPKPVSFYLQFRIENRRIIRNEFQVNEFFHRNCSFPFVVQELESLSPTSPRSKYPKLDRDEKIFARGPCKFLYLSEFRCAHQWCLGAKTAVHLQDKDRTEDYINANSIKVKRTLNETRTRARAICRECIGRANSSLVSNRWKIRLRTFGE